MVQFCCTRNLWQSHFDPKGNKPYSYQDEQNNNQSGAATQVKDNDYDSDKDDINHNKQD